MGLMVICAGVQALLEHELHNGNTDEMHQASSEISGWLRQRKEEIAWTGKRN